MRAGHHTHLSRGAIDYKRLRQFNAEAARRAILEYLGTNGNVSQTAMMFGINRTVVYDIIRKDKEGNLRDRSRAPKHQPRRTRAEVEDKVVEMKNQTHLGPERLSRYLQEHESLSVPAGTIRHILRRNKERLRCGLRSHRIRKEKREFVDWYSAKPFEIVRCCAKTWYPLQGPNWTDTLSRIIGMTNLILSSISGNWDLRWAKGV